MSKEAFIEGIIKLEKTLTIKKLVESTLNFKNKDGYNCLIVSFSLMTSYQNETRKIPTSSMPMFDEIESTIFYLIKLADDNKLSMNKILNSVTGQSLFWNASFFYESLALELLTRNVDVKTVDYLFQTVSFRVS